jgi:uncharacterized membrane protein
MPNRSLSRALPLLLLCAWLAVPPAFSADVVYKYIDDNGIPSYTEVWDLIPERYRSRAQALDPKTLLPVQTAPAAPMPQTMTNAMQSPPPTLPVQPAQPAPQAAAPSWLDRFAKMTFTLPSQYQMSVGLMTVILIGGVIFVMRFSSNPLVKVLGKLAIVLMVGGSIYAVYFSGLNDKISEVTKQPAQRTTSGKEIMGGVQGTAASALGKVTNVIDKTKAATIGEVNQTVSQANQSNRELDKRLGEIDPPAPR